MARVDNFFLVQIKRTSGAIQKGVVVKSDLDAAQQGFHAYLGAYAFGNDANTDYVQVAIKDSNGVDAVSPVVWRNDWEPEVEVTQEV